MCCKLSKGHTIMEMDHLRWFSSRNVEQIVILLRLGVQRFNYAQLQWNHYIYISSQLYCVPSLGCLRSCKTKTKSIIKNVDKPSDQSQKKWRKPFLPAHSAKTDGKGKEKKFFGPAEAEWKRNGKSLSVSDSASDRV